MCQLRVYANGDKNILIAIINHFELNMMTPIESEYTIQSIPQNQRNKMKTIVDKQTIHKKKFAKQLVLF